MKIKTLSELLLWSSDLELNEKQKEAVIHYIGGLEQIINRKNEFLVKIINITEKAEREYKVEKGWDIE